MIREIKTCKISCQSWHLYRQILAIADTHSTVFLYDYEQDAWFAHGLHHERQSDICAMAWRPHAGATLAVASTDGILLWRLALEGGIQFAKFQHCTFLSFPAMTAVSALAWSPNGRFLVAASGQNSGLFLWDVSLARCEAFGRGSLDTTRDIVYSTDGSILVQIFFNSGFRIWETTSWTSQYFFTKKPVLKIAFLSDSKLFMINQGTWIKFFNVGASASGIEVIPAPCSFQVSKDNVYALY